MKKQKLNHFLKHGSLKTACVFQRNQRRQRSNNGFAAAHIALQQAVHGMRLG